MAGIQVKNLDKPDESRPFGDKGRLDVVKLGEISAGLATFEPGWRWSKHVAPMAGTDTCEASHTGYCLSGRMLIRMDDGQEQEIGPGDAFTIEPGHDAWVVGREPCVVLDFTGFEHYAEERPSTHREEPAPIH